MTIIFDAEQYDGDWLPENLAAAIVWLQGKLESVPAEHRHKAKITIDTHSGYYEDSYAHIDIRY